MAKKWRAILDKAEKNISEGIEHDKRFPPINPYSPKKADEIRKFTQVGKVGIECNLTCFGDYISPIYDNRGKLVDVTELGINIRDESNSHHAFICKHREGKICVNNNLTLKSAIIRYSKER